MMISVFVIACVVAGLIFFAGGTLGLLRFPDFYSRLHPAGKLDTVGAFLVLLGLAIHQLFPLTIGSVFTGLKLMLIVAFISVASPTVTHAIVDAGFRAGLEPWKKGDPRR